MAQEDNIARRVSHSHLDSLNRRPSFRAEKKKLPPKQGGCLSWLPCFRVDPPVEEVDALFIGGGMVSATCASMLIDLNPDWKIHVYERLERCGTESSDGFNNAGTGHSGLCELNYTPEEGDTVNVKKAIMINHQFQETREYISYLVEKGDLKDVKSFINPTPHMSFCMGEDGVKFLKERWQKLKAHPLFASQEYSEDPAVIKKWSPLLMEGRDTSTPIAATYSPEGSDVNFGSLTRELLEQYMKKGGSLFMGHTVSKLKKQKDGTWLVKIKKDDMGLGYKLVKAKFVCVGAGGNALSMLREAGCKEVFGYGAFPISGQWLVCQNPKVAAAHNTKVYGQASVGAPPMSVPHLDARIIDGKEYTLFGPYAGWSPRFLKSGSLSDWFLSVLSCPGLKAIPPMAVAGLKNLDLVMYLGGELMASKRTMFASLLRYYPQADPADWTLVTAGQRVCIMKPTSHIFTGFLQFGTEVVATQDGSMTGLLGASPGASTTVTICLGMLNKCFPDKIKGWTPKILEMVPSYNPADGGYVTEKAVEGQQRTAKTLGLAC
jgi:malate dehydrogenase (quinone)